jgi:hypothetical protein
VAVIRQVKTERRCKLCQSTHRSEIDQLLLLRSQSGKLDDGTRVNGEYVITRCAELGIQNPTKENITGHWKNHCEVIDDEAAKAIDQAVDATLAKLQPGAVVDADAALDRIIAVGVAEIEERVAQGQRSGIGVDQVLKAIDSKTRRGASEAQSELLRELGGGIAAAFKIAAGSPPKQLDEPAIDAEFEEIPVSPRYAQVEFKPGGSRYVYSVEGHSVDVGSTVRVTSFLGDSVEARVVGLVDSPPPGVSIKRIQRVVQAVAS